jgi:hypothetical protein
MHPAPRSIYAHMPYAVRYSLDERRVLQAMAVASRESNRRGHGATVRGATVRPKVRW